MSDHDFTHAAKLLYALGETLHEAAAELLEGNEGRAAGLLRQVHEALQAAEPAPNWETLALVLEPHVARLSPPAEADDSWPNHEHLDELPDPEEEDAPPNLAFPLRKVN